MTELIKKLCLCHGASGDEGEVRNAIIEQIKDHCEYRVDTLGNIIAFKQGKKRASHKIMIDAHTDEVGVIATYITEDGLIKFSAVGGINTECLLSQRVRFKNGTVGVIGCVPIHMTSADERKKLPKSDDLYIDIGCDDKQSAEKLIRPGDTAVFDAPFCEQRGTLTAKAIDDRAGCAILIKLLQSEPLYDFYATFTVQEEIGTRGAQTAAFAVDPDFCICLEATTASDIAGIGGANRVCLLGQGPAVSFMDKGTLYDRELFDLAMGCGVKCQPKTAVAGGNNAGAIHKSRAGVRTLAISVPCRYIHSSSCCAKVEDITATYELVEKMLGKLGEIL